MTQTRAPLIEAGADISATVLIVMTVIQAFIAGITINALMAFGEEAGWRGWLQNALEPLGHLRPVLLIGVIWGLRHAPLIAASYNFSDPIPGAVAVLAITAFCSSFGAVVSWPRRRR